MSDPQPGHFLTQCATAAGPLFDPPAGAGPLFGPGDRRAVKLRVCCRNERKRDHGANRRTRRRATEPEIPSSTAPICAESPAMRASPRPRWCSNPASPCSKTPLINAGLPLAGVSSKRLEFAPSAGKVLTDARPRLLSGFVVAVSRGKPGAKQRAQAAPRFGCPQASGGGGRDGGDRLAAPADAVFTPAPGNSEPYAASAAIHPGCTVSRALASRTQRRDSTAPVPVKTLPRRHRARGPAFLYAHRAHT